MTLVRRVFDTPVGPMMALATDAALCVLEFWKPGRMTRLDARLRRWFPPCEVADGDNHVIAQTSEWLDGYFAPSTSSGQAPSTSSGQAPSTSSGQAGSPAADPPLDMRGAPFELRVWAALRLIPSGRTVSYGEIARQIGAPGSSRAVGMANGANPIAIIVPCHRVIGSNGTLTGYGGGLDRKAWLLDHERGAANAPTFRDSLAASGMLPLGD